MVFLQPDDESSDTFAFDDDRTLWCDHTDVNATELINADAEHLACFAHSLQLVVRDGLASITGPSRGVISKCCKLTSLTHQSALFRGSYEAVMGTGRSIPAANDTRWNSTYRQIVVISNLDIELLASLLKQTNHDNLVLSAKEVAILQELVEVLAPFAEATDLSQGEKTVTISCIVPTVLALNRFLGAHKSSSSLSLSKSLHRSLHTRYTIRRSLSFTGDVNRARQQPQLCRWTIWKRSLRDGSSSEAFICLSLDSRFASY